MENENERVPIESKLSLLLEPCPENPHCFHLTLYHHDVVYAFLGCMEFPSEKYARTYVNAKRKTVQKLSELTGQSIWKLKMNVFSAKDC